MSHAVKQATVASRQSKAKQTHREIKPERVFLFLAIAFGLAFFILSPPFEVPDEPQHFFRAFQLSEGRLRDFLLLPGNEAEGVSSSRLGTSIPKSVAALVDASNLSNIRFNPDGKVQLAALRDTLGKPLSPGERVNVPVATYPPFAYGPQIIGIWIGRILGLSPILIFYLARLAALIVWGALCFVAVRIVPVLKWAYVLLALMPMTLFLAVSSSADSVILGISFLASATMLQWAYEPEKQITNRDFAGLLAMALIIGLSKPVYLIVLFLFLLVPLKKFPSATKAYAAFVIILALSSASYFAWNRFSESKIVQPAANSEPGQYARFGVDAAAGVSSEKQSQEVRTHPGVFLSALANTLSTATPFYLNSFVGYLGWLDTPLPDWVVFLYAVALLATCALSPFSIGWKDRVIAAGVFAIAALAAITYMYFGWTAVGSSSIEGLQGRYLIPAAPALLLIFSVRVRRAIPWPIPCALLCVALLVPAIAAYALMDRFYIAHPASYQLYGFALAPDGGSLVIKGWATDPGLGNRAKELSVGIDNKYYAAAWAQNRFEASVPVNDLKAGEHILTLLMTRPDRRSWVVLGPTKFNVQGS